MKLMKWNFLLCVLTLTLSFIGKIDAFNDNHLSFSEERAQLRENKKNLSVDTLRAYIVPENSREIVLVDIKSGLEIASIPLESPCKILTTSHDGQRVYIASEDLCEIQSVDIFTKTIEKWEV